ncbi:hypothetical protein JOD24_003401 [Kroppenstedtia sanguinis]
MQKLDIQVVEKFGVEEKKLEKVNIEVNNIGQVAGYR